MKPTLARIEKLEGLRDVPPALGSEHYARHLDHLVTTNFADMMSPARERMRELFAVARARQMLAETLR